MSQPLHQIFCPNCKGGNPTNAAVCQWCKYPLQQQARQLQQVICPNCLGGNAPGTQACQWCKYPLQLQAQLPQVICPNCRGGSAPGAWACQWCKYPLQLQAQQPQYYGPPPPQQAQQPQYYGPPPPQQPLAQVQRTYEYLTVELILRKGAKGGGVSTVPMYTDNTRYGLTELEAKRKFWQTEQSGKLVQVKDEFEEAQWFLVSEWGPGAVKVETNYAHKGGGLFAAFSQIAAPQWVYAGLILKFRRVKGTRGNSVEVIKEALEREMQGPQAYVVVTIG